MMTYTRSVDPNSRMGKILMTVFLVLGILLLSLAVLMAVSKNAKMKRYVHVDGEIIRLDDENHPVVAYYADGTRYVRRLNVGSSSYRVGKTIRIAYDPEDPGEVTADGFMGYLASVILGFIGVVFTFVGGISLAVVCGKGKQKKKKKKEDVPIWEQ